MAKKKKDNEKSIEKYERAKKLAAARQRKRKSNMTQEQLEQKKKRDRDRYQRLKAENKIKLVKDMSDKEKKNCRKLWRNRQAALRRRKKAEEEVIADTPPSSDSERPSMSRQRGAGRKSVRKDRAKAYRQLEKQKSEINHLKRKLEKYKKRLTREKQKKNNNCSPSPLKRVEQIVGNEKVSPKIKKQLFTSFVLEKQIKESVKSVAASRSKRQQQIASKVIGSHILRKYRVQKKYASFIPYKLNKSIDKGDVFTYKRKEYLTISKKEGRKLKNFFLDDTVSKMCPGKKDVIKKGNKKMQRRILLESMKTLYSRFRIETGVLNLSYITFTRSRPFWVTPPRANDRETCACIKHENMAMLVSALKKFHIIDHKAVSDVVNSTVCSTDSENCMLNTCSKCKNHQVRFNNSTFKTIRYSKWMTISEKKLIKGTEKIIKRVVKQVVEVETAALKKMFQCELAAFKKHMFIMLHQAKELKTTRVNLTEGHLLLQIDFSQNYEAKLPIEIQSMHFGASKRQISLHTGVLYFKDGRLKHQSFCSVSDHLDHHAHAVWAHLTPILEQAASRFPNTFAVHIFSDSPSSQYRNRTNLYFIEKNMPKFFPELKTVTWNFSEPGHGKGAMDGIGGSLKRNADRNVLHGKPISCAKDLAEMFSGSKTKVVEISPKEVNEIKKLIPEKLAAVKGIMGLRQITWSKEIGLQGRRMSCFQCDSRVQCEHFHSFEIKLIPSHNDSQPTNPKKKLKVSDVYSDDSSDEDSPKEDVLPLTAKSFELDSIVEGTFLIVSFSLGKRSLKNFVAVAQSEIDSEREVNVMFFKQYGQDLSLFYPDETDISYISADQIVGTLPTPEVLSKGQRVVYKFSAPVTL